MAQKITKRDLDGIINRLNRLTGSPLTYSDKNDSAKGFKINVGHYHLDGAYGGYKLARTVNEGGGIQCPISSMGYETKRDCYYLILAFINGIESNKEGI